MNAAPRFADNDVISSPFCFCLFCNRSIDDPYPSSWTAGNSFLRVFLVFYYLFIRWYSSIFSQDLDVVLTQFTMLRLLLNKKQYQMKVGGGGVNTNTSNILNRLAMILLWEEKKHLKDFSWCHLLPNGILERIRRFFADYPKKSSLCFVILYSYSKMWAFIIFIFNLC